MGLVTSEVGVRGSRTPDLEPGTMVGDYRIDHTIGTGGMGAVYQATQPVIGKRVALKVLHRHLCENARAVERFVREARAVNQIGHPNIVDVFGFGTTGDGRAFLVMELLVGKTLAAEIDADGVPFARACDVLVEVTHALEAAHEAGIIHRDLKPDNIFLAARKGGPSVKLLDFGIAKLMTNRDREPGEPAVEPTRPGILIGTPRYISPEQVRGSPVDGRTDIYALGVVAFELFAGRGPFTSADPYELLAKHATLRPPRAAAFNPALPGPADDLLAAMLEKDPANRPTLAEVREILIASRAMPAKRAPTSRAELATAPLGEPTVEPAASTTTTDSVLDVVTQVTPARKQRRWIVPAAIGGVAIVAMLAAAIPHRGSDPAPIPRESTTPVALPTVTAPPAPVAPAPAPPLPPTPLVAAPALPPPAPSPAAESTTDPIELDANPPRTAHVSHGASPVHPKRVPAHAIVDSKPATPPTVVSPVPDKPAVAKPTAKSDDDDVRSPFEHKP